MTVLTLLLGGAIFLVFLPVTVLFAEVLLALTHRDHLVAQQGHRGRLVIVMPAHNEASIIAETLRSIFTHLTVFDRLWLSQTIAPTTPLPSPAPRARR
jgi:hypothetical protein